MSDGPPPGSDAEIGDWVWSVEHRTPCRVLETTGLWGQASYRIWVPTEDRVLQVPANAVKQLSLADAAPGIDEVTYASAAARILDTLARDSLVAPLEATVIPLPHQLYTLSRALEGDRVRYLLADEVGLGKTIEAGLILRELKLRGLVHRTLVIAPAGLVPQWVQEMKTRFHEDFRAVVPADFDAWRRAGALGEEDNPWRLHDQVVCPLDSVKPMDARRGWSAEDVARHNRERFEDLVLAGWDLVVIDEAHRLGGATSQVARYRLGEAVSEATPYLLLLSATPHQGKTDGFRRLLSFLDPEAFANEGDIHRERVAPYVIRTEKRNALDADGRALFQPRKTQLFPVAWDPGREEQRSLYDAVTSYARDGYNRAQRERRYAVGFLMLLLQRLVTSSTRAIRTALEKRLEVLRAPVAPLPLFPEGDPETFATMEGQEQLETLAGVRAEATKDEAREVESLLAAARRCEEQGPDTKARAILEWIQKLERDENDPALKVLVFTEFIPTQEMLAEFLGERGYRVVRLNGHLDMDERQAVLREFAGPARILVSTDAGGEGLNLQFCHVVVNYDLPWNPMKVEQRIGRVDRIGQAKPVRAINFALDDTVELRVREVLEEKLRRILEEFGVDKLSDVLDSEDSGARFEDLFARALAAPGEEHRKVDELIEEVRESVTATKKGAALLGDPPVIEPRVAREVADHMLPHWTERMTLAYLRSRACVGAAVKVAEPGYRLRWPDGSEVASAVFTRDLAAAPGTCHLTIEDPRVRRILDLVPPWAPGMPVPVVQITGVSERISGTWSLWRISLGARSSQESRLLPLFLADGGKSLPPTARTVWDRLLKDGDRGVRFLEKPVQGDDATQAWDTCRGIAEQQGADLYHELLGRHRSRVARERRKGVHAFSTRRKAAERSGLAEVRAHRLEGLDRERKDWEGRMAAMESAVPELTALLILRVAPGTPSA